MQNKPLVFAIVITVFLLIDFYSWQAIRTASKDLGETARKVIFYSHWGIVLINIAILATLTFGKAYNLGPKAPAYLAVFLLAGYLSKLIIILFMLADDLIRLVKWVISLFVAKKTAVDAGIITPENTIPRSEFLAKAAILTAAVPVIGVTYGVLIGAHDYHIRHVKLKLPNLPSGFEGLKIGQISDVHSGSFYNKRAVTGGVEMLMGEKPDMIFFTGDLVNNIATEMRDYQDIFSKIKAPMGVYSIFGNHDYGDYLWWPEDGRKKRKNLQDLADTHRHMGWNLMLDEHKIIKAGSDEIGLIGIQNWGARAHFPKYGSMKKATANMPEVPVKLLLSHDPSHWEAQVLPQYPDIDVAFAGHTHGMQFGVEVGGYQWSPVKYMYPQWGGLYLSGKQQIYVNRGFGFLGFPGRIGMPPEITMFTLTKG
ncbi:MAG: metallophosphoesterase [Bacteroidota bacterium]